MEPGVAILLSTKNGAAFVREQIATIQAQNYPNLRLFWRDDGSTDDTVAVVGRFGLIPQDIAPIGITASYRRLLQTAYDAGLHWFAFADQDDIWPVDKMTRGINRLREITGPALYCGRQTLVDADLRHLGVSPPFRRPVGFPAALTQNIATGCTVLLNRPAAALVLKTLCNQPFHDWWCYLIVAAAGGRIITDDAQVIQYRQHGANTIGAPTTLHKRALAALRRGPGDFMAIFRLHVMLLTRHADLLSADARHDLGVIILALQHGPVSKWRALRLPGFHRQTSYEDALFRLWFMIG